MVSESLNESDLELAVLRLIHRRGEALLSVARQLGLQLPPKEEKDRLLAIKAAAQAPERCGPEIPLAPARGLMMTYADYAMRPKGKDYEAQHLGFQGRDAARAADVFDVMTLQARRRGGFDPFTPAQVETGRYYAALVERHAARGMKCVSVETQAGKGGSGSGGYMDAVLAEGEIIQRLEAAIGDGFAVEVQRAGSGQRQSIGLRWLVTRVCIEGITVSDVLKASGWSVKGDTRAQLYGALAGALDRMAKASPGRR